MTPTTEYPIQRNKNRLSLFDRFNLYVNKSPGQGPNGDCWEWTSGRDKKGYGSFWGDGKPEKAHRIAYFLAHGFIDKSLQVLHSCDNPPCCNPDHLRQGTNGENQQDSVKKGRHKSTKKTHCPRGHEYTSENTRFERGGKKRVCRMCFNGYRRKLRMAKVKAKLSEKAALLELDEGDYAGALLGWVIDDELEKA